MTGTHLITGAGSGIGACVAAMLQARGDTVVLLARSEKRAAELAEHFGGADTLVADLTDPASASDLRLPESLGSVVHAAGGVGLGPGGGRTPGQGRRQGDVHRPSCG